MAGKGKATIVVRKEEVVEGGHHGGAWKVAYADFVTAMMAFFLLMWLLNATTEQQRRGLADYFSPNAAISRGTSGFGLPFGGRTPNSEGALVSDQGAVQIDRPKAPLLSPEDTPEDPDPAPVRPRDISGDGPDIAVGATHKVANRKPPVAGDDPNRADRPNPNWASNARLAFDPRLGTPDNSPTAGEQPKPDAPSDADIQAELDRRERSAFERAAQQIRDAVRSDPDLADLSRQLMIDITPEGLRIQLLDEDKQPMFPSGSAALNDRARALLLKVAPVLLRLPESVSIAGHTDGAPYRGGDRTNWDLSADRANATRRLLTDAGLPEARLRSVAGLADRDPLIPGDKLAAANRRIAITVLHGAPSPASPAAR